VLVGLTGCSQQTQTQLPCPSVVVVSDASSVTTFISKKGQDLTDIDFEVEIDRVGHSCFYDSSLVTVNTLIRIKGTRGPRSAVTESEVIFFVAIVDKDQNVVGRERFETMLSFNSQRQRAAIVEEIEQIIPIRPNLRGFDYQVLIGFELTPPQLEYNRDQRRRGIKRRLR